MELQVREARLTDIDRVLGLIERADVRWSSAELATVADLLRQLIYLPNAAVLLAHDGRLLLGAGVLALRPSVSEGGLVGTIDLLAVEPGHELSGVTETLINELASSARNKGCVLIEAAQPEDPAEVARWESLGFSDTGARLSRSLAALRAGAR
ncbi:MAG: GNAT family N-acetyltransferase [Chloroflexota bacterium]|nr:GNAT family N-acetyltransferase [Chloroflexota bacterium]